MQHSITSILSLTEIFDTLTANQLELIASICVIEEHAKGHILLRENEESDELYVIGNGGVEILMNPGVVGDTKDLAMAPITLTEMRPGQVFGEISLVDQGLRSATVIVSRNGTQLLRIARERLMLLCDTYPELGYRIMKNLAADLAFKIRNTDLTIRQYQLLLSKTNSAGI